MRSNRDIITIVTVEQASQASTQAPGRVLVVEDTADIRDLLKEILSFEGYDVVTAEDGLQALERLAGDRFDLVLTDLMMPGMHGIELLARLEEDAQHPPIIAMSAFERFREEATQHGAVAFLSKPVDIDVLLREVRQAIFAGRHH